MVTGCKRYVNNAAVQSASCISMMNVMYLWLPFAFDLIITIILSFMNIEGANEQLKEVWNKEIVSRVNIYFWGLNVKLESEV